MRRFTARQALNTVLNEAEVRLQSPVVHSLPQNVDIVLTKACNLACTFCVDYEPPGATRISIENLEKVARQLLPTARLASICRGSARYPRTIIRSALMRSNVEELPDAVARWGDMGIDRMDCGYLAVCNGIDPQESLYFHQDLMSRAFAEARRAAARYPRLRLNLPPTV